MKRGGVINKKLSEQIAGLGHTDYFMICDAGFPIPEGVERVDLALAFQIPTLKQCLKTVLDEVVVEKVCIAEEMEIYNQDGYGFVKNVFVNQPVESMPQNLLARMAKKCRFILRSGELAPYSNVIMQAGSGVEEYKKAFIIDMDQIT